MFFILSKILFYLLTPATWIFASLVGGLVTKKEQRRKRLVLLSLVLFFVFGNHFLANLCFMAWEPTPIALHDVGRYEVGIVLTGVIHSDKTTRDRVFFNKGADRVLHTIQLYKLGKLSKILITGGSGRVIGEKVSEAIELKKVFLYCGVPEKDLIIEPLSRNTRENALFSKYVLDSLGLSNRPLLLITSAFHMPRSKGCFDKVGLKTDTFPVDYYSGKTTLTPDGWLIPTEKSFSLWHILIHEWLGYFMYLLVGYR